MTALMVGSALPLKPQHNLVPMDALVGRVPIVTVDGSAYLTKVEASVPKLGLAGRLPIQVAQSLHSRKLLPFHWS